MTPKKRNAWTLVFFVGIILVVSSIIFFVVYKIPEVGDCEEYDLGFCVNYWDPIEIERARITNLVTFGTFGIIGCVMVVVAIVGLVIKRARRKVGETKTEL